ncbi:MAG: hypothetical protein ACI81T_003157 [Bacteroidia bacterium]|jgi:hypothetical protein
MIEVLLRESIENSLPTQRINHFFTKNSTGFCDLRFTRYDLDVSGNFIGV